MARWRISTMYVILESPQPTVHPQSHLDGVIQTANHSTGAYALATDSSLVFIINSVITLSPCMFVNLSSYARELWWYRQRYDGAVIWMIAVDRFAKCAIRPLCAHRICFLLFFRLFFLAFFDKKKEKKIEDKSKIKHFSSAATHRAQTIWSIRFRLNVTVYAVLTYATQRCLNNLFAKYT